MRWEAPAAPSPEQRVREHAPLVRRIALHLAARLPAGVELDDLIQAGTLGLLEAAHKFEAGHAASFETYAGHRIRGAILDELRRGDWAPRSVHRSGREIAEARRRLEQQLGRPPSEAEVAAALDMDPADYRQAADDAALTQLDRLEGEGEDDLAPLRSLVSPLLGPEQQHERGALRAGLAAAIRELPERDQLVLSLYYREELHQKEIGAVLGVTESRVCQLHARALKALRAALSDWQASAAAPAPTRDAATAGAAPA